jgi:NADPH:quinone reductase-like Zn-dependent oxidoreductase
VEAAALNHRDQYIREGLYSKIALPAILGSDAVGHVGERRVLINPMLDWGSDPRAQAPKGRVLGMPEHGTLAEYIAIGTDRLWDAPSHLSAAAAAALPLAGLTTWRALFTQGELRAGQRVLITGIGGGVATMAMVLAVAAGAEVHVTSTKQWKLDRAREHGVTHGVLTTESGWSDALKKHVGGYDLVIDSVGGPLMNDLTNVLIPGGMLVSYGSSAGFVPQMNMHRVFWKQLRIIGSTMGTDDDFTRMLAFVSEHRLEPIVDVVLPLERAVEGFERMRTGEQFGRIVITP